VIEREEVGGVTSPLIDYCLSNKIFNLAEGITKVYEEVYRKSCKGVEGNCRKRFKEQNKIAPIH
jgi:hypothetical protein